MDSRVPSNEGLTLRAVQAVGGAMIIVLCATTIGLAVMASLYTSGIARLIVVALISLHGGATLMLVGVTRVEAGMENQRHVEERHVDRWVPAQPVFPVVEPKGYK